MTALLQACLSICNVERTSYLTHETEACRVNKDDWVCTLRCSQVHVFLKNQNTEGTCDESSWYRGSE